MLMRVHFSPWLTLILVSTVLAGCFGSDDAQTAQAQGDEVQNLEGMTARLAIEKAWPAAKEWREDALLVGAQAEEHTVNVSRPDQAGIGAAPPRDPAPGDGRAPMWLVGFRSGPSFLLVSVDGDGRTAEVKGGFNHPLGRTQAVLGTWHTDSPEALQTALDQPAFAEVAKADDVMFSLYLRPADPSLGGDPATARLAENPHWVLLAISEKRSLITTARVDAVDGAYVDNGQGSQGEGEPVHEHAAFALFIKGEQVLFNHPDYDVSATKFPEAHLRTSQEGGGDIIHIEGLFPNAEPDITLAGFLASLDIKFSPGVLTLDNKADHNGTLIADGNGRKWSVYASERNGSDRGPFVLQMGDYSDLRLRDGLRVLITFTNPMEFTDAEQARQQAAIPEPPLS